MSDESLEVVETTQEPSEPVTEEKQTEETDSQDESKTDDKPEKPLSKAEQKAYALQKRIDRQTAANRAAQEKIEALQSQLREFETKQSKVDDAPKEEDYETFEEYQEAIVDYKANKRLQERLQAEKQQQLQAEMQKQQQQQVLKLQKQEEAFRSQHADYDEVKKQADLFYRDTINRLGENHPTLQRLIGDVLESDFMPELFYEIGNNPEFLDDLVSLSPTQASFKLFEFKQSLGGESPEQTNLPTPIKSTKASGQSSKPLSKTSGKEILDWVNS